MLKIKNNDIYLTRGDEATINISVPLDDGTNYVFQTNDVVYFTVKKKYSDTSPILRKEIHFAQETEVAVLNLTKSDTTLGGLKDVPIKYVYDISINAVKTIIGYDEDGAKYFVIYPEASDDE